MTDEELLQRALQVRDNAYAPYSRYAVGCAILAGGKVYTGANVENVSYGAVICAERSAVAAMVSDGVQEIERVALITQSSPPVAPCGLCRQTMQEFASDPESLRILIGNTQGERIDMTLAELLPKGFRKRDLEDAT
jgi:cytidine deaminase